MSLVVHASGLKGAAPRRLRQSVDRERERLEELLTEEQVECIEAMLTAANKLISRTPRGKQVDVQLLLAEGPFGAVEMSVAVTATRPRSR